MLAVFFLSGAAGLVYEVVWARSLGLVFGASHLAVSTVLAVYMAGQALGSRLLAGLADRTERPLRLYGLLELGVAASGLGFLALRSVYAPVYAALAGGAVDDGVYLTLVRILLATAAMIVPTTLMGATLPVMTRALSAGPERLSRELPLLYAVNTFGAVSGTVLTAFLLLPSLGATRTLLAASASSAAAGAVALLVARRPVAAEGAPARGRDEGATAARAPAANGPGRLTRGLVLAGAGASGFCALGYEVLWTRMLTLVVGTSVYSFAIMLAAFLSGIGLGSEAYRLLASRRGLSTGRPAVALFGATQLLAGASALAVTVRMADLPATALRVQAMLVGASGHEFVGRVGASALVAFAHLAVPAFFMGVAFPAAGAVWCGGRRDAAGAVGRLLAVNTAGAILGPLVAGFLLIRLLGIELSLQLLVLLNVAVGGLVLASVAGRRWVAAAAAASALLLTLRIAAPGPGRAWDRERFARFVNNARPALQDVDRTRTLTPEVVFFREGVNETVAVTRTAGLQSYVVNGRPEASTAPVDVQLQRSLGHIPMLLHPHPRSVFILGTGTAMTLGACARHPSVERLVLGEIEAEMIPVGRTFARWNGGVLDDPRLRIVVNDGRNHLATTGETFDVVSADPIHPWSGGAGYLYTADFFRIVSRRLAPGGIASQWLPLYELTERDVRTVVRTSPRSFPTCWCSSPTTTRCWWARTTRSPWTRRGSTSGSRTPPSAPSSRRWRWGARRTSSRTS